MLHSGPHTGSEKGVHSPGNRHHSHTGRRFPFIPVLHSSKRLAFAIHRRIGAGSQDCCIRVDTYCSHSGTHSTRKASGRRIEDCNARMAEQTSRCPLFIPQVRTHCRPGDHGLQFAQLDISFRGRGRACEVNALPSSERPGIQGFPISQGTLILEIKRPWKGSFS